MSNAGNPCAWRFFISAVWNHVGILFRFEATGWLRVCANISVCYVCPVFKPAQMQDSCAQTNWARTNAGLRRTNGHSAPDSVVSTHHYAPIVGRILQTWGMLRSNRSLCKIPFLPPISMSLDLKGHHPHVGGVSSGQMEGVSCITGWKLYALLTLIFECSLMRAELNLTNHMIVVQPMSCFQRAANSSSRSCSFW